jgi:hypothetical protein
MITSGGEDTNGAVGQPVSLEKSAPETDNSLPELQSDSSVNKADAAAPASRSRRVVTAAAHARDRTIGQLVALLVPLIRATRYPSLVVLLAAAVPAVTVIILALLRPGPDDGFWIFLGIIGLIVAGWFGLRRHQLLAIAQGPDGLADALSSVVSGRDMWEQLVQNVSAGRVGAAVARRSRPLRVLRGMWRGVQLTGVLTQITERPELTPLMPGRLRGMWFLGIACLITSVVLGCAVLVAGLLYLLGA